jgi:hypothetical protein
MSYYLYLIETKKEYTIHLINELTPLMYEGIQSIYQDARDNSNENEELKQVQRLLRKIQSWNEHLIEQETNRIIKNSSKSDIIEDLINAVIKSNIMILTNTPPEKKDNLQIKHDITTRKFIHNSYIEIARNIFQNPYLFYHKLNAFELKKNQRECHDCIKKSIEQSIRKLLPMNIILQNYLGKTFDQVPSDDFQNPIIESDYNNLKQMLNKNSDVFQLIKHNKINANADANDDKINIKLDLPATRQINQTTDNFKTLKELGKQNESPKCNILYSILESENTDNKLLYAQMKKSYNKQLDKQLDKQISDKQISDKQILDKKVSDSTTSDIRVSEKIISDKKSSNYQISDKKISNYQMSEKIASERNNILNCDSEDASASYFRQNSYKKDFIEVYNEDNKTKNKQFLDYNKLDDDTSIDLKSMINSISSVSTDTKYNNINNKKKYFSKNNNL